MSLTRVVQIALVAVFTIIAHTMGAKADRLSFSVTSEHVGPGGDWFNEVNPGVFYTFEGETFDYTLGIALNSYGGPGYYATGSWSFYDFEQGELSVFAGAAYYPGYGEYLPLSKNDVTPFGGVQGRYRNLWAQVLPIGTADIDYVVAMGVTFDLTELR